MTKFMVAMPVASEVKEEGRKFAEEVAARRAEFVQSRRRLGVTRERGWLQATPNGDVFILLLEGDDPVEANRKFAASHDPFDVWFKIGPEGSSARISPGPSRSSRSRSISQRPQRASWRRKQPPW